MEASGLFFLRMHASTAVTGDGGRVLQLPVVERDPQDHRVVLNTLTARWKGPDALAFWDAHQGELRAGRPLRLTLDRLRGHDGQWWASVVTCELAPVAPSWAARLANPPPAQAAA